MGRREDLEEMRAGLLEAFRAADPAVAAQIAGQLRLVVKELDELPSAERSSVDELQERRRRRRTSRVSDGSASG